MPFWEIEDQQTTDPRYSFFSVHLEPRDAEEASFDTLIEFINLADEYNIKITLQFTPQWVEMVLADSRKLNLIKTWQDNGHEIAAHHHGARHQGAWDGYTDLPEEVWRELRLNIQETQLWLKPEYQLWKTEEQYLGNMDDYIVLLNKLVYPDTIKIMTMGFDRPNDWQPSWLYSLEGTQFSVSLPEEESYNQNTVYEIRFRYIKNQNEIENAKREYLESQPNEFIGVVLHLPQYVENKEGVEGWFKFLREDDPEVRYSKTPTWLFNYYFNPEIVEGESQQLETIMPQLGTIVPLIDWKWILLGLGLILLIKSIRVRR